MAPMLPTPDPSARGAAPRGIHNRCDAGRAAMAARRSVVELHPIRFFLEAVAATGFR